MSLGRLRGPSWFTDAPRNCPNGSFIISRGGLDVNEFRCGLNGMKESQLERIGDAHPHIRKERECVGHPARRACTKRNQFP